VTLTVLSVAYPLAPVGPAAVGGAEQVLGFLDRALVQAGHRSVVIACGGSGVAGELVEVPRETGPLDDEARERAWRRHRAAIAGALRRWPIDLVHLHGFDFHEYLPAPSVPALATLHLPPSWYPAKALRPGRQDTWLHCVSRAQHEACPASPNLLQPIENGVPVEALAARHAKRSFALMLGRVCPEKGIHLAIEAAKRAGVGLLIAGEVFAYTAHQRYFAEEVAPRLDRARRFIGPIGFARKRRLLTAARCLLIPSTAPETSSLVAREAFACGTPVVAFPNGALAETIEHGRTGFLVEDVEGMVQAIRASPSISPAECRRVAGERFSLERMVEGYFEVYRQLAGSGTGQAKRPAVA
jgi:glycosyltransferase involved in cell wall biosynthesis